jgi:hypothetical protein
MSSIIVPFKSKIKALFSIDKIIEETGFLFIRSEKQEYSLFVCLLPS